MITKTFNKHAASVKRRLSQTNYVSILYYFFLEKWTFCCEKFNVFKCLAIQSSFIQLNTCNWIYVREENALLSAYHTSHDSLIVVTTTFKVYGKRQTLTLSQPKTPKLIVTKFEWRDYVVDIYHQKKNYGLNPFRGFCSPYKRNMHPLFEIHYTFLVLQLVGVGSNSCFSEPRSWAPDWPLSPTSIRLSIISIL